MVDGREVYAPRRSGCGHALSWQHARLVINGWARSNAYDRQGIIPQMAATGKSSARRLRRMAPPGEVMRARRAAFLGVPRSGRHRAHVAGADAWARQRLLEKVP